MPRVTWLADVARDAGLRVQEHPGWRTRGNPNFSPRFVMAHHTATRGGGNIPTVNFIATGSPIAPLSQYVLGRDGLVVVIAAGRCNHAGAGRLPNGSTSGNSHSIGIEAENDGRGETWGDAQMDAYVRLCAALLNRLNAPAWHLVGHKEYALPRGRKVDPTFPMGPFRADVTRSMSNPRRATRYITPVPVPVVRGYVTTGDDDPRAKEWKELASALLPNSPNAFTNPNGLFGPMTVRLTLEAFEVLGLSASDPENPRVGPVSIQAAKDELAERQRNPFAGKRLVAIAPSVNFYDSQRWHDPTGQFLQGQGFPVIEGIIQDGSGHRWYRVRNSRGAGPFFVTTRSDLVEVR